VVLKIPECAYICVYISRHDLVCCRLSSWLTECYSLSTSSRVSFLFQPSEWYRCCAPIDLFGGRVLDELDALGDVATKALVASLEKLLLVVVCAADDVDGLLGTAGL